MLAPLQFAVVLFLGTLAMIKAVPRLAGDELFHPLTRAMPATAAALWVYAVTSASLSGTWPMHVPGAVASGGAVLVLGSGVAALVMGARPGSRPMRSVGVLLVLLGVALAGRSTFAVALSVLFAIIVAWSFGRASTMRL